MLLLVVPISDDVPSPKAGTPRASSGDDQVRLPTTAELPGPGAHSGAPDASQATRSDDARISAVVPTCDVLVVSPFDAAIPEARVVIEDGEGVLGEGRWPSVATLTIQGDEVAVRADAEAWGDVRARLTADDLRALQGAPLRLVLDPPDVAWGRVFDVHGRAAGIGTLRLVMLHPAGPFRSSTDLEGWFPYPMSGGPVLLAKCLVRTRDRPRSFGLPFERITVRREEPLELEAVRRQGVLLHVGPDGVARRRAYDVQLVDASGASTMTSAYQLGDGVFLELEEDGGFRFRVGTDGRRSGWVSVDVRDGHVEPAEIEVTLDPVPPIVGTVVDDHGQPIPGTWVAVDHWPGGLSPEAWPITYTLFDRTKPFPSPPEGMGITLTDEAGAFLVPFRLGKLIVHHPAYAAALFEIDAMPDRPVRLGEGTVLHGRVEGRESLQDVEQPLFIATFGPGTVSPYGPVLQQRDAIAADDSFRLTAMRPGRTEVSILTEQGAPLSRTVVDIPPRGLTDLLIPLTEPFPVRVTVPGSDGAILRMELHSDDVDGKTAKCLGEGDVWSASLDWSGDTGVWARFRGRSEVRIGTIQVVRGQEDYTVELPGTTLRIRTHFGTLRGEYTLDVQAVGGTAWAAAGVAVEPDTWIDVPHVTPGRYTASVACQDGEPAPGTTVALAEIDVPPSGLPLLEVELTASFRVISCEVRAEDGRPLDRMRVNAEGDHMLLGLATTDANGLAELTAPAGAAVRVLAYDQRGSGYRTPVVDVPADVSSVRLTAVRTVAVDLVVLEADGTPCQAPEVALECLEEGGEGFHWTRDLDEAGATGDMPMMPGRWLVRVTGDRVKQFVVGSSGPQRIEVRLPP